MKTLKKNDNFWLKPMNNTKANGLQNDHFSKISVPVLICSIKIWETALNSLVGSLESYCLHETVKKEQTQFVIFSGFFDVVLFTYCSLLTTHIVVC